MKKKLQLEFTDTEKVFDPDDVYGDAPKPNKTLTMSIVETISYELWDKDPEAFADQLGKNHKQQDFA